MVQSRLFSFKKDENKVLIIADAVINDVIDVTKEKNPVIKEISSSIITDFSKDYTNQLSSTLLYECVNGKCSNVYEGYIKYNNNSKFAVCNVSECTEVSKNNSYK